MACEDARVRYVPLLLLAVACGDDGSSTTRMDAAVDGRNPDAPISTTTALTATIKSTQVLDVAYYGVNANGTLYVEAYKGATPGCPDMNTPAPDYTLILGSFPTTSSTAMSTANLFDYVGDLHDNFPQPLTATSVMLSAITYVPNMFVALDADLTFPGGTLTGHLYATHCTSLDG